MAEENVFKAPSPEEPPVEQPVEVAPAAVPGEVQEADGEAIVQMAPLANAVVPKKKKKKKDKKKDEPPKLGTSRGIETMFRTSYRVNMDLSALADTKSNMIMGVNSIVISVLLAAISPKIDANPWLLLPTSLLLIGCLISLVYAILAARPRVSSTPITLDDVRANKANILFFGNFSHMPRDEYIMGMTELMQNTDKLYYNMIRDIYGLGGVLQKKFKLLRTAYTALMIAVVLGVFSFVFVYIWIAMSPATPSMVP